MNIKYQGCKLIIGYESVKATQKRDGARQTPKVSTDSVTRANSRAHQPQTQRPRVLSVPSRCVRDSRLTSFRDSRVSVPCEFPAHGRLLSELVTGHLPCLCPPPALSLYPPATAATAAAAANRCQPLTLSPLPRVDYNSGAPVESASFRHDRSRISLPSSVRITSTARLMPGSSFTA